MVRRGSPVRVRHWASLVAVVDEERGYPRVVGEEEKSGQLTRGQFRVGFGVCLGANLVATLALGYVCALYEYPPEGSTCEAWVEPISWFSMVAALGLPVLSNRYAPAAFPAVCFILLIWAAGVFGLAVSTG